MSLANAMHTALMEEMRAQGKRARWNLSSDGDMLVSTAQAFAAALGCRWEARLIRGTQPLSEGVALVRDTDP